jgi:hypothetical protein
MMPLHRVYSRYADGLYSGSSGYVCGGNGAGSGKPFDKFDKRTRFLLTHSVALADRALECTGKPFVPWFAAGGITVENIRKAMSGDINLYGVDVSSGAETAGKKDRAKIGELVHIVHTFRAWRSLDTYYNRSKENGENDGHAG